jgi:hypothetical protein
MRSRDACVVFMKCGRGLDDLHCEGNHNARDACLCRSRGTTRRLVQKYTERLKDQKFSKVALYFVLRVDVCPIRAFITWGSEGVAIR